MRKLGTSDLHFGHANIFKFTGRCVPVVKFLDRVSPDTIDSFVGAFTRLRFDSATDEDKRLLVAVHEDWLVDCLNRQIDDGDIIYHTGDFSFYKGATKGELVRVISRLKGNWMHILGNHDNESALREACHKTKHKVLGHYHEISVNGRKVVLSHYPMQDWHGAHRGSYMLHGHLHGTSGHGDYIVQKIERRHDIGLDAHADFRLFILEDLVNVKTES